ncbi:MAG: SDR family NAD(P)-dependent oxidoreductase [Spirochaetia bacterium]|nr:SDR family NAD(P)-dependent oxidoreductase [Spirochaetia bacterium]
MGTFLVTGAAKRLGAAMSEHLAKLGYDLILHYRESKTLVEALQKKIEKEYGRKVRLIQKDLVSEPEGLVGECLALAPDLAGLINNASIFTRGNLGDTAHFETLLRVNAVVPQKLSSDFHKLVGRGHIVNIVDALIADYNVHFQNYRISKSLLEDLTLQSARHFAPKIRVNGIAPGPILAAEGDTKGEFDQVVKRTPLGFSPGVSAIVDCLDFILRSEFLTGQILYADSGQHLS